MSWPTPQDYNEAIQAPQLCFSDPDLRGGTVETTALGLPRAITGAFASVYKVVQGDKAWAVRCFLNNRTSQKARYQRISEFVLFDDLECTVDFHYLDEGIKIRGNWFPCLKMPWVDGKTLDHFVEENYSDPESMAILLKQFRQLAGELERAGIAHGDLQHGNIMVTADGLRLVDYDALYVPSLAGMKSLEVGHPNYQHPERSENNFDCSVDNFSQWLIHASLLTISIDPELYRVLKGGDEHILFKRTDLRQPESSRVFEVLLNHPAEEISSIARLLVRMIWARPYDVPPLVAPVEYLDSLPDVKPEVAPFERNHGSAAFGDDSVVAGDDAGEGAGSSDSSDAGASADGQGSHGSMANRYDALFDEEELAAYSGSRFINTQAHTKTRRARWKVALSKFRDEMRWRFARTSWCAGKLSDARRSFDDADYDAAIKSYLLVYSRLEQDGANSDYLRSEYFDALIGLGSSFGMLRKATLSANYFLIALNKSKGRAPEKILRSMFLLAMARMESGNKVAALKVLEEHFTSVDSLFTVTIAEEVEGNVYARRPSAFSLVIDTLSGQCSAEDGDIEREAPRYVSLLATAVRLKHALKKEKVEFSADQFRDFMALGSRIHRLHEFKLAALFFENLADLCELLEWEQHERALALLCCAASNFELEGGHAKIAYMFPEFRSLGRRQLVAVIDAAREYLPVTELIVSLVKLPDDEWIAEVVESEERDGACGSAGGGVSSVVAGGCAAADVAGDAKAGVPGVSAAADVAGGGVSSVVAGGSAAADVAGDAQAGVPVGNASAGYNADEGPIDAGPLFGPRLACACSYLEGGACLEQIIELLDPLSDEDLLACLKSTFLSSSSADDGTLDLLIKSLVEQKQQRWLALVLCWLMDNVRDDLLGRMTVLLAQRNEYKVIDWLGCRFAERYQKPLMSHLPADVKETFKNSMATRLSAHVDSLDCLALKLAGRGASSFEAGSILDEGANGLELIVLYLSQEATLGQNEHDAVHMQRIFGATNARFVSRWLLRLAADAAAAREAANQAAAEKGEAAEGAGKGAEQKRTNQEAVDLAAEDAYKAFCKGLAMLAQFGHSRVFEVVTSDLATTADRAAVQAAAEIWIENGQALYVVSLARAVAGRGDLDAAKEIVGKLRDRGLLDTSCVRHILTRDSLLAELCDCSLPRLSV